MLKLFVLSIQSALPLCLALAILLASRAYSPKERRIVARWTGAASAIGLILAGLIAYLRLNSKLIDVPTFNAYVGPVTFLAIALFLVAVWIFGGRDLHDIDQGWRHRFLTVTALAAIVAAGVFYGFTYFFNTSGIVPMGSSILDSESLLRLAGYSLGTILVIVAAWGYVVSAARVPWYIRTAVTTIVFAAMVMPRAILLYQQFATRQILPRSSTIFSWVLWIQRNEAATQLTLAILIAVPGIIALWTHSRGPFANPAEVRARKADQISRRKFVSLSVVGSALFVGALTVGKARADYVPELSAIEPSTVDGDWVTVSRELVSDGHLHRFAYTAEDSTEVRFIVIQKNESAFGTGLDACEICGNSGYYEDKGKVICRECDVMMNIQTIGFVGGCNPIPLDYEIAGDTLRFSVEELESHTSIFKS
ncbi:Fe-S-containing protein [Ancrocorticia sp.]|uniref:Fe-S-containing protein n=1 Tax=Ancrocorticia sp. TaxID=2593684 RepID=UPI003F931CF5